MSTSKKSVLVKYSSANKSKSRRPDISPRLLVMEHKLGSLLECCSNKKQVISDGARQWNSFHRDDLGVRFVIGRT